MKKYAVFTKGKYDSAHKMEEFDTLEEIVKAFEGNLSESIITRPVTYKLVETEIPIDLVEEKPKKTEIE